MDFSHLSVSINPIALRNVRNLKKFRKKAKLSLKQLAYYSRLGLDAVTAYENGTAVPNFYAYNKLALFLGWKPADADAGAGKDNKNAGHVPPDFLIKGNSYMFRKKIRHSRDNCEKYSDLIRNRSFRFEGLSGGLFSFRAVQGNWTVTLSRSQLLDYSLLDMKGGE